MKDDNRTKQHRKRERGGGRLGMKQFSWIELSRIKLRRGKGTGRKGKRESRGKEMIDKIRMRNRNERRNEKERKQGKEGKERESKGNRERK